MEDQPQEFLSHFVQVERPIRALLLAATGDMNLVDDLMQNVAVALWKKWPEYDSDRPFIAWALGIARIEILRWRRSASRNKMVLDAEVVDRLVATADWAADEADHCLTMLSECVDRVEGDAREILNLKYRAGMRARQIAAKMGKRVGTVEMILTRTRRALRECMKRKLAEV